MKTLQTQYNLIKEGKGDKAYFMKLARYNFPDLITPVLSYNDTITVLKNRSILSEGIGGVVTTGKKQDWHKIFKENITEYGEDSGGQDMTYGMYNRSSARKNQGNQDFVDKGKEDFYDDVPYEACPYEDGYNKYYKADLAKLWQMGWKEAEAEDQLPPKADKDIPYMGLTEAKEAKAEEKETTKEVTDMATRGYDYKDAKNYDNVFGQEFLKGFYTEMQDPKNKDKTVEELRAIVAKNLAKDLSHYVKDGQFGIKGVGYTTEAPGLGESKPITGPHKSSGYGDLKESVLRSQIYLLVKEVLAEGNLPQEVTDRINKGEKVDDIAKDFPKVNKKDIEKAYVKKWNPKFKANLKTSDKG